MILAGILLKIGGYGLVRLAWPLAPPVPTTGRGSSRFSGSSAFFTAPWWPWPRLDFKKLVAYSSVSHMAT